VRRLLRTVVALVGLLVLATGVAVAGFVGSDDTVFTPPAELAADGRPILTAPDLIGYQGLRVTLRAEAADGVFIATAHPVDVADYLGSSPHVLLDEVTRSGVHGTEVDGAAQRVRPEQETFWTHAMSGTGTRELSLDAATGEQWVIAPIGSTGPVTVSLGATVDGVFVAALVAAGVGLLLLLLAVELMLRAGRRRRAERAARRRGGARRAPRHSSRVRSVALVAVAATALTGCQQLTPVQPRSAVTPTKVALTEAELPALFASYDVRNNAAITAAGPPDFDAGRWRLADRGAALEADLFGTRLTRLARVGRPRPLTHTGVRVYAPRFGAYPMWALVAARQDGTRGGLDAQLFTRASVTSPWLMQASTLVDTDALPRPAEPSPEPGPRVERAATAATAAWSAYLEGGSPDGIEVDDDSLAWRRMVEGLAGRRIFTQARTEARPYEPDAPVRVVRVADGHLALVTVRVTTALVGRRGLRVHWRPPLDRVRRSRDGVLTFGHLATGLVLLPAQGRPRLLGATFREVSPG
jgi:hypothetical protein